VQWHPEWRHTQNPFYENTLRAFADACRIHRKAREET
jgi:putative glutamine amidotransferase